MDDPSDTIVEIREELMVPSMGGDPTLRIGHFLTPTIKGPVFNLLPFPPSSIPPYIEPHKKLPLRVSFWGWRYPRDNWKTWVEKMATLHETTWKKAGIYEAVLNSTYEIVRDNDLVFGVAEKWCSETNTFIFPWGEITITLEDTMVLGGYSVLGDSVLCSVDCKELKETEERLEEARREIARTIRKKADKALWMKKFMDSGSEVEHEAFLACWLSRYVFITTSDSISKHLFPIAIQLARGTRIALAPAVLASIYRDLSLFKEKMIASSKLVPCKDDEDGVLQLTIFSPFHLVQIWAWERFLELRPNPNVINNGEPRIARWNKVISHEVANVRLALDSAGESFQWRPYTLIVNDCKFPKFYAEKEKYISVGPGLDEELQSFARCLRVAELVGLGCIEQYLPHRVAMQFGMDQDLPVCVPRLDETPEIAWNYYSKPACNMKLYVPPRLFEADVTVRYLEWWKQSILGQHDASNGAVQQQREPRGLKRPSKSSNKQPKKLKGKRKFNDLHVTPGFSPKFNRVGVENCNDEDGLTIAERMKFTDKRKKFANSQGKQHGEAGNSFSHFKCLSSSTSDYGPFRKLWKKDVAKGVADCQRDSNCSKQSSKNSKGHMSGNDASVPPGFPPKCNRVHIEDSDEEDKLTVKELLRSCDINSGVGNGISGNGKTLSDLHITPGFSPKFNWVGMENCNDEDGLTIAERMKFTDKRKKFANSQGKQHGEAGNSFSHCKCLSSSTFDYGPFRKLWKKDVAKGVADCQRDSNCSKQSSKNSKGHMSGNDASVPPGFPPKCNRVHIEDSDEEDKLTVKELLRSCDINSGVGNGISGNGKPLSDLHITPGFSPKFNWVGVENCNDEDGLTIAERMKFTNKCKKFANSQGKQLGEAGNSFSHCKCLSFSTSDYGPLRKLRKKDVAKGVADCQRDSNCSKQSSKNSKGHMSGNDASVPPGFPPKCNRVHIEDSDEEDKLTVKELLRSCGINSGVGNGISGNGKPLSDLHITPGFSPKFNWVGVENCNDEDGLTIAERMKFTDKHKKFTNSQGKQHGEAGNSFSYFECLSSSTSNNCPVRKLGKKEVAKGVADCQRDSNSSRQSSKSSKRSMSGNNASVPPGFPPKCNRVNIEDSDEEDKLTVKELLRSCNINNGVVNRISGDGKPLSDAKSLVLSSLTTENGKDRMIESLMEAVGKIKHGEVVIVNAEGSMEDTTERKEECEALSMEGINVNEGERSRSCAFEMPGLEIEARIRKLEKVTAEQVKSNKVWLQV